METVPSRLFTKRTGSDSNATPIAPFFVLGTVSQTDGVPSAFRISMAEISRSLASTVNTNSPSGLSSPAIVLPGPTASKFEMPLSTADIRTGAAPDSTEAASGADPASDFTGPVQELPSLAITFIWYLR